MVFPIKCGQHSVRMLTLTTIINYTLVFKMFFSNLKGINGILLHLNVNIFQFPSEEAREYTDRAGSHSDMGLEKA